MAKVYSWHGNSSKEEREIYPFTFLYLKILRRTKELLKELSLPFFKIILVYTHIRIHGKLLSTGSLFYGPFFREKLLFYYRDNYNSSKISKGNSINYTLRLLIFSFWTISILVNYVILLRKLKNIPLFEEIIQGAWVGSIMSPKECVNHMLHCFKKSIENIGCRMSKLHGWPMLTGSLIKMGPWIHYKLAEPF